MRKFCLLLALLSLLFQQAVSQPCPPKGDSHSQRTQQLDIRKNRTTTPASFDNTITLDKILSPGKDLNRFSNDAGAKIEGYIISVIPEGGESCNCHSNDSADYDYHIYLSQSQNIIKHRNCIVVEITPKSRTLHPEWTEVFLNGLIGKKVSVGGWMLYDFKHKANSLRDNPNGTKVWRNTCWEVHPVTSINVVP